MAAMLTKVYVACLVGGLALSVVMLLSGGSVARFRLPRVRGPRIRLPRIRLPRLGRAVHVPHAPSIAAAASQATRTSLARIPPGTVPVFVGMFATLFGATGLVCLHTLGLPVLPSLVAAGGASVLLTTLCSWALLGYFVAGTEAGEIRGWSPIGAMGQISLAVPEGGVGAVAVRAAGKRVALPARGRDGCALALRARVMIVDMDGHIAVVEEFDLGS